MPQIPQKTAHELTRMLQEALVNAIRHGGAREVTVTFVMMGPGRRWCPGRDPGPAYADTPNATGSYVAAIPKRDRRESTRTTCAVHLTQAPGPVCSNGKTSATSSPGASRRGVSKYTLFELRSMVRPVPSSTAISASMR